MKRFILISYFLFLISYLGYGQINYVINPNFEDTLNCPSSCIELSAISGWGTLIQGGGSPDIYHTCCPSSTSTGSCSTPINVLNSYQYPKSGSAFTGIRVYATINQREYLQGKLTQQLLDGRNYCVKLYVNLCNRSRYSCNNCISAYFDDGSVSTPSTFGLVNVTPQINNISQQLNDTLNWIKIEDSFIADGTEEYITLGNFLDDSSTDVQLFDINASNNAYYNIEDVSVIDISTPAYAGNDTTIAIGDSIFIGRQPEIGLNDDCIWYVNGNPIDTVAGLWVMPDSTTTYILEQTICGYTTYDTVTVTILPTGIDSYSNKNAQFEVYPNPANNVITIKSQEAITSVFKLLDLTGKEILKQYINMPFTQIDIQALPKGIYFYQITNKKEQYSGKLVVE